MVKLGWYLIEKYFKGGKGTYALRLTRKIWEKFANWDDLLEYIGEHTEGGHGYGYRVNAKSKDKKPKADKTLSFGMVTEEQLIVKRNKGGGDI